MSDAAHAAAEDFRAGLELLALLHREDVRGFRARLSTERDVLERFLSFVRRHGLRQHLAIQTERLELAPVFDDAARQDMDQVLVWVRRRQRRLLGEVGWVDALFRRRGIPYRLFKGPALAQRFFGDVRGRDFNDLDVLVPSERLAEAHAALVETGAKRLSKAPLGRRVATWFAHGWDYQRDELRLDLHWALATHFSYRIDMARLWNEAATVEIEERPIPTLSEESMLLFFALSFFEDLDRGAGRLKSVVDLDTMVHALDGRTDWPTFFERARTERVEQIVRTILALVLDLMPSGPGCPALAEALAGAPQYAPASWPDRRALLESPRGALSNKLWAADLFACGRGAALGWWGVSLPFRLSTYDPGALRRLARVPWR